MIRHNLKVAFDDDDNPKRGDNSSCVFFPFPIVKVSIHYFLSTNATGISRHDLKIPLCQSFLLLLPLPFFPSTLTFVSLLSCFNHEMTQLKKKHFIKRNIPAFNHATFNNNLGMNLDHFYCNRFHLHQHMYPLYLVRNHSMYLVGDDRSKSFGHKSIHILYQCRLLSHLENTNSYFILTKQASRVLI